MFGRKVKYEMVKFSMNDQYRVEMLRKKDKYMVYVVDVRDNRIAMGGADNMTAEEADKEYNKQCFMLGIGERACE